MEKTIRPKPPDDLSVDAATAWHQFVDELDDAGKLEKSDRAIIALAAETWATWRTAANHVKEFGPVVEVAINKTIGRSPFYSVMMDCAKQLAALLAELGLTPKSRPATKSAEAVEEFDFK